MFPYHNPGNIPGIGCHEPGQLVTTADLSGRSKEGQGFEGMVRNEVSCD